MTSHHLFTGKADESELMMTIQIRECEKCKQFLEAAKAATEAGLDAQGVFEAVWESIMASGEAQFHEAICTIRGETPESRQMSKDIANGVHPRDSKAAHDFMRRLHRERRDVMKNGPYVSFEFSKEQKK